MTKKSVPDLESGVNIKESKMQINESVTMFFPPVPNGKENELSPSPIMETQNGRKTALLSIKIIFRLIINALHT